MEISDNIKNLRELLGIKPAALAKKIGVDRELVYAWEAGKYKPSEENLDRLAAFFQVSKQRLIFGKDEGKGTPVEKPHNDLREELEEMRVLLEYYKTKLRKAESDLIDCRSMKGANGSK